MTQILYVLWGPASRGRDFRGSGDLAEVGEVGDFLVGGEEEGFGEDDGQRVVAFEREVEGGGGGVGRGVGDDAEVLVVGFHEDVSGAEVDFVGAFGALDAEEFFR